MMTGAVQTKITGKIQGILSGMLHGTPHGGDTFLHVNAVSCSGC